MFQTKIVGRASSALERQVWECVLIRETFQKEVKLLNRLDEYSRCLLPELAVKLGNRTLNNSKDPEDDERQEIEEEKELINTKLKRFLDQETIVGEGERLPKRLKTSNPNHKRSDNYTEAMQSPIPANMTWSLGQDDGETTTNTSLPKEQHSTPDSQSTGKSEEISTSTNTMVKIRSRSFNNIVATNNIINNNSSTTNNTGQYNNTLLIPTVTVKDLSADSTVSRRRSTSGAEVYTPKDEKVKAMRRTASSNNIKEGVSTGFQAKLEFWKSMKGAKEDQIKPGTITKQITRTPEHGKEELGYNLTSSTSTNSNSPFSRLTPGSQGEEMATSKEPVSAPRTDQGGSHHLSRGQQTAGEETKKDKQDKYSKDLKLNPFFTRKAGPGSRSGGRGSPTTKGSGTRPLTTFGFIRRQQEKEAPSSRGEELGSGGDYKEGGRGFTRRSVTEYGAGDSQGEKEATTDRKGDRTGVRMKGSIASGKVKRVKVPARGSIGAGTGASSYNYTISSKTPKLIHTLNSNPKGVQTSLTDWIQKGQPNRAQSMGSRHQTPGQTTLKRIPSNPEPGIEITDQESDT